MSSPGAAGGGTKGGEEEEEEEEEEEDNDATLLFVLDRLVGGAATMLSAIVQEQTHFVIRRAFPHLSLCIFLLLLLRNYIIKQLHVCTFFWIFLLIIV